MLRPPFPNSGEPAAGNSIATLQTAGSQIRCMGILRRAPWDTGAQCDGLKETDFERLDKDKALDSGS
jgi:hypothetical protein